MLPCPNAGTAKRTHTSLSRSRTANLGEIIINPADMALSGHPAPVGAVLERHLFTNYIHTDDKSGRRAVETCAQIPNAAVADRSSRIENFKPSVTGEVLGENGRSYRRGCERRFAVNDTSFSISNVTPASLLPSRSTVTIFILVRVHQVFRFV